MYSHNCLLRSLLTVDIQVMDVTKAITNIIMDPESAGKTYELTGLVLCLILLLYILQCI